jgi:hypothetical protein
VIYIAIITAILTDYPHIHSFRGIGQNYTGLHPKWHFMIVTENHFGNTSKYMKQQHIPGPPPQRRKAQLHTQKFASSLTIISLTCKETKENRSAAVCKFIDLQHRKDTQQKQQHISQMNNHITYIHVMEKAENHWWCCKIVTQDGECSKYIQHFWYSPTIL